MSSKRLRLIAMGVTAVVMSGCAGANAFGSGALSPLEDLNLRKKEIPAVLSDAVQDPYGQRNLQSCRAIAWEVGALNDALGPDLDEPPAPPNIRDGAAYAAGSLAAGFAIDAAAGFLPVRDWARQLSGAERRGRAVQAAIQGGRVRRAFMKGMGMRMNCPPPAAPSWFRPDRESRARYRYD